MTSPVTATRTTSSHDHPGGGVITCRNCSHEYSGQYCSQCGQRADTHPINWHYIWHEIPHSIWHVDRGIAFSLRELTTRPGHSIREFLEGRRVNHYRPLALLLMLGALLLFVQHWLGVSFIKAGQEMFQGDTTDASARFKNFQNDLNAFIEHNQNLLYIFMIPFFAFGYWLMFRRQRYNYPEMLVVQTFITNFHLLVSLVIVVLFWALGGSATAYSIVMGVSMGAMLGYNTIVYYQLMEGRQRLISVALRSIAGYAIGYSAFIFVIMLITAGYIAYEIAQDPSAFKSTKPASTVQQPHK